LSLALSGRVYENRVHFWFVSQALRACQEPVVICQPENSQKTGIGKVGITTFAKDAASGSIESTSGVKSRSCFLLSDMI
jgi:hypothetical protein